MTIEEAFPLNFKRIVKERGYKSVRQFSREKGFTYQQMCRYTSGEHLPSSITAWELSRALECSVDDLLKGATR